MEWNKRIICTVITKEEGIKLASALNALVNDFQYSRTGLHYYCNGTENKMGDYFYRIIAVDHKAA